MVFLTFPRKDLAGHNFAKSACKMNTEPGNSIIS